MTYKKNQTVESDDGVLLCILADDQLAAFANISDRVDDEGYSYVHIDYESVYIYDNTGTVNGLQIAKGHRYTDK